MNTIASIFSQNEVASLSSYFDTLYQSELNGVKLHHTEVIKIFIRFMENSAFTRLAETEAIVPGDCRHGLVSRIEIAILTYYHSVKLSRENGLQLVVDTVDLGYSNKFSVLLAGGEREASIRVGFLDRYFYTVEHFIQTLNKEFNFLSNQNTKGKQQVFSEMLNFFGLGESHFTPRQMYLLIDAAKDHESSDFLSQLQNNDDRKIKYTDLYEFVATIRNSLHNNGFANKTINSISIGKLRYQIKRGEFIDCLSVIHLLGLLIPLTKILEEVVVKTVAMKPGANLSDPYAAEVQKFLAKHSGDDSNKTPTQG